MKFIQSYITYKNFLLFFSLIAAWPCVFYLMGYLPNFKINIILLLFLGILFCYKKQKTVVALPKSLIIIISFQLIAWTLYTFVHFDFSYITRVVFILTSIIVLLIDNIKGRPFLIRLFVYWVTLQSVLSLLGFILSILGLLEPISTFEEMDGRTGYNFGICTSNVYIGQFIRPSGFFDEPGALACWGIHALVFNKLFIYNKKIECVLLISLISTLSLAFFIQSFLYLLLFYRKYIKQLFMLFGVIAISLSILINQDEVLEKNTIGRLEYDKREGTISGDNRSDYRKNAQKIFFASPIMGVGATNLVTNYEDINSNEFTFLASDGVVGMIVTLLPYLYLFMLGKKRKEIRYALFVLVIGLLQRPFDFNQLLFPLLIYSFIKAVLSQGHKKKCIINKSQNNYDINNNSCL